MKGNYGEGRATCPSMGLTLLALAALLLAGCSNEPKPIRYGVEACTHCKMTVADARYASQLVSAKGKAYTFDAIECMAAYLHENPGAAEKAGLWVTDFMHPETLLPVTEAKFLQSRQLHSPMGMNLAAFGEAITPDALQNAFGGDLLDWQEVLDLAAQKPRSEAAHAYHPGARP